MFRSLATAASGMEAQQTKLDVTANNIANVSTNGFKKQRAEFADLRALASDEAEFFQGLPEEFTNVPLAIGDANARRDSAPAECGELDRLLGGRTFHRVLLR